MAISNSASKTIKTSSGGSYTLKTSFTETKIDENNNSSILEISASLGSNTAAFSVGSAGTLYLYWHDELQSKDILVGSLAISQCGNTNNYDYGTKTITKTYEVKHADTGNLSGYSKAKWTRGSGGNNYPQYVPVSGEIATSLTSLTEIQQGTLRIYKNNKFYKAKAYIRKNNTWKLCRAYVRKNNTWKNGK